MSKKHIIGLVMVCGVISAVAVLIRHRSRKYYFALEEMLELMENELEE